MRKLIAFSIANITCVILAFFMIFLGVKFYNSIPVPEGIVPVWSLIVFILTAVGIMKIFYFIVNKACSFSTIEGATYEILKKKFPYWSDVTIRDGYLFISWKSLSKNIIHNYEFDFNQNKAKFYDEGEVAKIVFEGDIKKAVSKMRQS